MKSSIIFIEKANYTGLERKHFLRAFFVIDGKREYFTTEHDNKFINRTFLSPLDIMQRFLSLRAIGFTDKLVRLY